ncbi:MAG: UvrD-helicase domain-containing protein [Acidobacteria bacterium]|nr:UvrD-helicase domain-containing protein [Acidobacteriota bacterium]
MSARDERIAADQASRRLAQSEFERPVVVVAGAGTGKTALLVSRVVVWCVGPGWDRHAADGSDRGAVARRVIERVVAITFTEAAAAEMARKIGAALIDLATGENPIGWDPEPALMQADEAEIGARARALSEESHRLVVSTIHAFCQRLLSTYPMEAGIHPRFEVDPDGARLEMLAEDLVEESLRNLAGAPDRESWERLAVEGFGPPDVVQALCDLSKSGADPALFAADPFGPAATDAAFNNLSTALGDFASAVGDRQESMRGSVSILTRDAAAQLGDWVVSLESTPSFCELSAVVMALDERVVPRLKKWSKLDLTKSEASCFGDARYEVAASAGRLAAILKPLVDPPVEQLAAARSVVAPLLRVIDKRRTSSGILSFSDLLRHADGLLRNSAGVRREVVAGIDHLLVDEFQDTDDVQCGIVQSLALTGPEEHRPSLFIVGDPKQSIYAWRSADLAAYDAIVNQVEDSGGLIVDLVRNFRSVTPILDEVERLVAPVMREERGIQPRFEPLEATDERRGAPGFDRPPWSGVEHWLAWPSETDGVAPEKGNSDTETSRLEAKALAGDIERLHREGGIDRWGDVAVLLRVTTAQEALLKEFRRHGIPYDVAREREYYRQREVVEIAALVRTVLEPTDQLALLTVLRSDVVGVPDAALAPLWDAGFGARMARLRGGDPASLAAVRECIDEAAAATPTDVPGVEQLPRWPTALQMAVEIIVDLRAALREDAPDLFVEKIRTQWLAEVTGAARFLGRFRRARLDRFFADLESTLAAGDGGDAGLARFLRRAVEEGRESSLPLPPDLEADAVHVMTIHGAKGLDFEHVYVAQIHKGGRGGGRRDSANVMEVDGRPEYHLFGWTTPGYPSGEWLQARKSQAEIVRLLYVATTRAKQRLVVSGGWPQPGKIVPPEAASHFAALIGRRLDSAAILAQRDSGREREIDEDTGVQHVFPAFAEDSAPTPDRAEEKRGWSPTEQQLLLASDLAAARMIAAGRMEQPVLRSASAEAHDRLQRSDDEEGDASAPLAGSRDLAMAIGTAVHDFLEAADLGSDLAAQLREAEDRMAAEVTRGLDGDRKAEAERAIDELIGRIGQGECLERLASLGPSIVARELPVYGWEERDDGPEGVVSGIVDLVYRDPDDGRLVVADYKTDAVDGGDALEDRAKVYEPQVTAYAKILRVALDLDEDPLVELWFLAADQIKRL